MSNKCHQSNITKRMLYAVTTLSVAAGMILSLQPALASPYLASDAAAKATPKPKVAKGKLTPTPTLPPPVIFLIRPLNEAFTKIDSIRTTVDLDMAGNLGKTKHTKKIAGRLTVDISSSTEKTDKKDAKKTGDDGRKHRFTLTGDLAPVMMGDQLGDIPFTEWGFALYRGDHFAWILKDQPDCFRSKKQFSGTEQMEKLYVPDKMSGALGSREKGALLAGWLIGEETINEVETKHYRVDIDSLKKVAKDDKMPDWSQVDVWVAKEGEYLVKLTESSKAKLRLFTGDDFDGTYSVALLNSNINKSFDIELPQACDDAQIPRGETVITEGPQAPVVSTTDVNGTNIVSNTEVSTNTVTVEPTAQPAASKPKGGKLQFEGSGSQMIDLPEHGPSVVEITFAGSNKDTLYVARLGADNKILGPLVNVKGAYGGMRPLDVKIGDSTKKFQIQSSGKWRLVITPFGEDTAINVPGQYEGKGSEGIALLTGVSKPTKIKMQGKGDKKPFVVTAYNMDGVGRPLVSAQQVYEGQADLAEDIIFIDVQASTDWKIEVIGK